MEAIVGGLEAVLLGWRPSLVETTKQEEEEFGSVVSARVLLPSCSKHR